MLAALEPRRRLRMFCCRRAEKQRCKDAKQDYIEAATVAAGLAAAGRAERAQVRQESETRQIGSRGGRRKQRSPGEETKWQNPIYENERGSSMSDRASALLSRISGGRRAKIGVQESLVRLSVICITT